MTDCSMTETICDNEYVIQNIGPVVCKLLNITTLLSQVIFKSNPCNTLWFFKDEYVSKFRIPVLIRIGNDTYHWTIATLII